MVEWQTRKHEGLVPKGLGVQLPPRAPKNNPVLSNNIAGYGVINLLNESLSLRLALVFYVIAVLKAFGHCL